MIAPIQQSIEQFGLDIHSQECIDGRIFNYAIIQLLDPVIYLQEFLEKSELSNTDTGLLIIAHEGQRNEHWKGITLSKNNLIFSISRNYVQYILNQALGEKSSYSFSCRHLSIIEKDVIASFLDYYLNKISIILELDNNTQINTIKHSCLMWGLNHKTKLSDLEAKACLSLPEECLTRLDISNDIKTSTAYIQNAINKCSLILGSTKLPVSHIKKITHGDLILLNDSQINTIQLQGINTKRTIPISAQGIYNIPINLFDYLDNNMTNSNNEFQFGDFEIEVHAEFRDINIRLSELMKLTEGQVLNLAELANTTVYLVSQNKTLASGQLIINDNKFGILVGDINDKDNSMNPVQASPLATLVASPDSEHHSIDNSTQDSPMQEPSNNQMNMEDSEDDDMGDMLSDEEGDFGSFGD